MVRRKSNAGEVTAEQPTTPDVFDDVIAARQAQATPLATATQENATSAGELATTPQPQAMTSAAPTATSEAQTYAAVDAPPKGEGRAYTIDNNLGYRKEDSHDGKRRQIRFADRPDGQKPDDDMLAPVREQKPAVSWSAREKAWQARKNPDDLEALDSADQKLAEIGRKRTGGPER